MCQFTASTRNAKCLRCLSPVSGSSSCTVAGTANQGTDPALLNVLLSASGPKKFQSQQNQPKKCVVVKASCTPERKNLKRKSPGDTIRISSSNNSKAPTKSVRFGGTVKVIPFNSFPEDMNQTWYSPLEYKNFQSDSKQSLKAVTSKLSGQVGTYDSSEHCLRGLEACISSQVYHSRKEEKVNIVNEVLNLQLLQQLLGVNDPENLAELSRGRSKQAQERALLLAALDDSHRK